MKEIEIPISYIQDAEVNSMTNQTRPRSVISLLIIFAVVITLIIWNASKSPSVGPIIRGGPLETHRLQPMLDSSTPRIQGHFQLVDVERTDREGTITLATSPRITIPSNRHISIESSVMSDIGDWDCLIKASGLPSVQSLKNAAISNLPLHVTIARSDDKQEPFTLDRGALGHTDFPAGVLPIRMPPVALSCEYVDIKAVDDAGKSAQWRLVDPPHYRNIPLTPNVKDEHILLDGVAINLTKSVKRHNNVPVIETSVLFTPPPSKIYTYELRINQDEYNIEQYPLSPAGPISSQLRGTMYMSFLPGHSKFGFDPSDHPIDLSQIDAVLTTGALETEICRDETVTFHNFPSLLQAATAYQTKPKLYSGKPMRSTYLDGLPKLTTASGVQVILVPERAPGTTHLVMTSPPTSSSFSKIGKNQQVSYKLIIDGKAAAKNYFPLSGPGDGSLPYNVVGIPGVDTPEHPIKDITVQIRHLIDIKEAPFSVTLPLHQIAPSDKNENSATSQFSYTQWAPPVKLRRSLLK
jgi:hypothetical protein